MRQMIFYAMTEAETFDPAISTRSLADIKAKGFDSIYLEFRNTRAPHRSPRFRQAVWHIGAEAKRLGLAVVLDSSLNHYAGEMLADHPELFTDKLEHRCVPVRGGLFTLEFPHSDPSARGLEMAWLLPERKPVHCRLVSQASEGGGCAMTDVRGGAVTRQEWTVDGVTDGELFVVTRQRFAYANRDLGHPALLPYVDQLCEFAAGLGVAGVVWDEPHFGFDFLDDAYPVSDRLYDAFAKKFGYELRPRLIELWLGDGKVRLDFAELLESQLAWLEGEFKRRAPTPFVGIHRTMHEELSDDFRIGSADYFRHNRGTSAGFTDSVFEREDSMVTMAVLARALGRLSGSGEAWNNSWGFHPTAGHLAYYLRLLGCLGVRWIGHTYHSSYMFGPGYPHHPTWAGMGEHLQAHRELLERLDGATPVADTAIVYDWRALATYPGNYLHQHRRDLLMACLELVSVQAAVTIIEPSQLPGNFRRVLALWCDVETDAEVLRIGGGEGLKIPYGATIEIAGRPFTLDPALAVPNWRSNPANTYADHAKATELGGGEPVARWNGKVIGVRQGNVTTVATELPQFPGALTALWPVKPVALPGFLAFPYTRGKERLLALCARHAKPVSGEFEWEGTRIECRGCRHGVLRRDGDGTVTAWLA